ncbi:hypothetical protein [Pedomonas sp. V897]|uniref:hypothetical protein n=1 Tax=Pedomonas sp. V897 TaxID=3446482 RepID=UPI003EE31AB5
MTFASTLFRRSLILGAGSITGRLLPLLALLGIGRTQAADSYASVSAAFAWTAVAASLTTGGLAQVLAQRLSATDQPLLQYRLIWRAAIAALLSVTALACMMFLVGPDRASSFFGNVVDARVVVPAIIAGACWSLAMVGVSICNGLHATRSAALITAFGGLLQGLGMGIGALVNSTPQSAVNGLAAGAAAALGLAIVLVIRHSPPRGKDGSPSPEAFDYPSLFRPALWATLANICVIPVTFFVSSLVVSGPRGAQELAMFHALEQVHIVAVYVSGIVSQALLPLLSRHLNKDNNPHLLRQTFIIVMLIGVAGTVFAALLGLFPRCLEILFGNNIVLDTWAVRFMLLNAGMAMMLALTGSMLHALGRFRAGSLLNVFWASALVALALLWKEHGCTGIQAARWSASAMLMVVTGGLLYKAIFLRSQVR